MAKVKAILWGLDVWKFGLSKLIEPLPRVQKETVRAMMGVGLKIEETSTFKSWLFSHKFVPRTFKWRFTADPGDETIGGRFFIGEYLTLEGNVGLNDNSSVFLMFRYSF